MNYVCNAYAGKIQNLKIHVLCEVLKSSMVHCYCGKARQVILPLGAFLSPVPTRYVNIYFFGLAWGNCGGVARSSTPWA